MNNILHEYMSNRYDDTNERKLKNSSGPLVTLSRIAGCSSQRIAKELSTRLNQMEKNSKWDVISKEVLYESAQQLKLNKNDIKSIFKIKDQTVLDEIMNAFLSKEYHLQRKMKNTVVNVIRNFANEGHKIILGRAANIICEDVKNALHIRIDGPIDWRIKNVIQSKKCTKEEAIQFINKTEKDRQNFRKSIRGKSIEKDYYDITINQVRFSNSEIVELIIDTLKLKKIIQY